MRLFSIIVLLLFTLPESEGRVDVAVFLFVLGVATNGRRVGVRFGVAACDKIPMSFGVSLSLGVSKCFAANFLAAGDMLARRSVLVRKLDNKGILLIRFH